MNRASVDRLRALGAAYWQPIISLLALIPAGMNALGEFYPPLASWKVVASTSSGRYLFVGAAVIVLIAVRFPRVTIVITRIVLGPPPHLSRPDRRIFLGPQSYTEGDAKVFFGRQRELDDCLRQISQHAFTIIEGESGCGKSSLLNAALVPALRQSFRVVICRPADDPFRQVYVALKGGRDDDSTPGDKERLVLEALRTSSMTSAGVTEREGGAAISLPVLLVLDQFEEIFVTVPDSGRARFGAFLKEMLANEFVRVVLVTRNDFTDLVLRFCRLADPRHQYLATSSYCSVGAFSGEEAGVVLRRMLEPLQADDPLLRDQLETFANEVVQDLLRPPRDKRLSRDDTPTVLPVELQTVGMTLEALGANAFSQSAFRRVGRKAGLYRRFIDDSKTYVYRKTGIPGDDALLLLRKLISPAMTKWALTAVEVARGGPYRVPDVAAVFDAFADKYLVRRLAPGSDGASSDTYELMHEHLIQVLQEAPDPALQRARDADERLAFWTDRTHDRTMISGDPILTSRTDLLRLWAQPIPLIETIRLWKYADSREQTLLRANLRGWLVRVSSALVVALIAAGAWLATARTDRRTVVRVIESAPIAELESDTKNDELLMYWVRALSYAGNQATAELGVSKLKNSQTRSTARSIVSDGWARAGHLSPATNQLELALNEPGIDFGGAHGDATETTLGLMFKSGETDKAIDFLTARVKSPLIRAQAATSAIAAAVTTGNQPATARALQVALDALATGGGTRASLEVYAELARRCQSLQLFNEARRTLALMHNQLVRDPNSSGQDYRAVAEVAALLGEFETSVQAFREGALRSNGYSLGEVKAAFVTLSRLNAGGQRKKLIATADELEGLGKHNPFVSCLRLTTLNTDTPAPSTAALSLTEDLLYALGELTSDFKQGLFPELRGPILDVLLPALYQQDQQTAMVPTRVSRLDYDGELTLATNVLELGATSTALRIADRLSSQTTFRTISSAAAFLVAGIRAAHFDFVLERVGKLTDVAERNWVRALTVAAYLEKNKTDDAIRLTKSIEAQDFGTNRGRPSWLGVPNAPSIIATAWARRGERDAAIQAAAPLPNAEKNSTVRATIARELVLANRASDAIKVAELVSDSVERSAVFADVAIELTLTGNVKDSGQAAAHVYFDSDQSRTNLSRAISEASAGRLYEATNSAERCSNAGDRMRASIWVVLVYAERQSPELAPRIKQILTKLRQQLAPWERNPGTHGGA